MSRFMVELVNTERVEVRKLEVRLADPKNDRVYDFANRQMDIWQWPRRARQVRSITLVKEKKG